MSLFHSPSLVTSGLVLCLDAGNPKSYPGSGTTWTDLSGNGNTGTLVNGPTYNSANGGSIVFDGVNDYIDTSGNVGLLPTAGLTLSAWAKTSTKDKFLINKANGSVTTGYALYQISVGYLYFNLAPITLYSTTYVSDNVWHYMVGVWTPSSSMRIYVDGVMVAQSTTSIPAAIIDPGMNLWIGKRGNGADLWNGNISSVSIYNRALSAAELQQNFNALRGRYGV